METEALIAGVVVVGVVLVLLGTLRSKRKPPVAVFKCHRCGTAARHSNRTEEAWRNGKTTFFCAACHARWLQTRPAQERSAHRSRQEQGGSGCLGVIALFALIPLGGIMAWLV